MGKPTRGDYHLAGVERTRRSGAPGSFQMEEIVYRAQCSACGWSGAERSTKGAAEDDALAHDVTEND